MRARQRSSRWALAAGDKLTWGANRTSAEPLVLFISLPWPPTVNHYWRTIRNGPMAGRVYLSEDGKGYRQKVAEAVLEQRIQLGALRGKLSIRFHAMPPDRLVRDLDNLFKGPLDALKHALVYRDDGDVDELSITRYAIRPGGELQARIAEIPGGATDSGELFSPND